MPLPKNEAWFPAKTYGYGWGLPRRWQGWGVMVAFFTGLFAGSPLTQWHPSIYVGYLVFLAGILTAICYWKGEKPRWRWGNSE